MSEDKPMEPSKEKKFMPSAEAVTAATRAQLRYDPIEYQLLDAYAIDFAALRAELHRLHHLSVCEACIEIPSVGEYIKQVEAELQVARDEIERLKERQPDWSPGDVIAAYADGSIVLDDGKTTWNPDRACKFLQAETERMKLIPVLAQNKSLQEQLQAAQDRFTRPIVCMCGSTKFKQTWIAENARLTGEGLIVLPVGLWGHHERIYPSLEMKEFLDETHKRKIDLCDWVWVLDVGGYIGDSTRSEIEYASKLGRQIKYLSQEFPDYVEPIDPLQSQLHAANERLAKYREDFRIQQDGIVKLNERIAELDYFCIEDRKRIAQLEQQLAQAQAEACKQQNECHAAMRNWEKSRDEAERLQHECERLKGERV